MSIQKPQELQKAMELLNDNMVQQRPAKTYDEANRKCYEFWETQPVPKLDEENEYFIEAKNFEKEDNDENENVESTKENNENVELNTEDNEDDAQSEDKHLPMVGFAVDEQLYESEEETTEKDNKDIKEDIKTDDKSDNKSDSKVSKDREKEQNETNTMKISEEYKQRQIQRSQREEALSLERERESLNIEKRRVMREKAQKAEWKKTRKREEKMKPLHIRVKSGNTFALKIFELKNLRKPPSFYLFYLMLKKKIHLHIFSHFGVEICNIS